MRILFLILLFALPYYFYTKEETPVSSQVDQVKLKMGAPNRLDGEEDRMLTSGEERPEEAEETPEASVEEESAHAEENQEMSSSEEADVRQEEEVQFNDLEEGWNKELKEMLTRLEPAEGEEIHKAYTQEQENYQAELDALLNEKSQKTTDEAVHEIEQLVGQLDQKHQEKLKDILGAHYEAVRDGYEAYMDSASSDHQ